MENIFNLDISFDCKSVGEDNDHFTFEGMGSTSDIDLTNDIVEPTAFTESLQKRTPALCWQHNLSEPVGVFTSLGINPEGLKVAGKMPKADDFVRGRVIPQMRVGAVKSLSIGFRAVEVEFDKERGVRIIKKLELFEISLVTIPANPHATIHLMKSFLSDNKTDEEKNINNRSKLPKSFADRGYRWDATEAEKRVRAWAGAEDGPNSKYKSTFIYFDPDNDDTFGGYKLLVADVIGGEIKVVPRAVFAVRAVLSGARGGVDIPEEDKIKAKQVINVLYKDMDLEEPFNGNKEKSFCLTEIKNLCKSHIDFILRNKNLSKDASRYVTDLVNSGNAGETSGDTEEVKNILDDILITLKGA